MSDHPERIWYRSGSWVEKVKEDGPFSRWGDPGAEYIRADLCSVPNTGTIPDAEYDLEVAAFAFANSRDVPADAQKFIRDLWRAYCKAEARSMHTRSTEHGASNE